jgi:extracellular matrix regulatory protein A
MMISLGHGHFTEKDRIVIILDAEGISAEKLEQEAADRGMLIDATSGRPTRSLVLLTSNHVVRSAVQSKTLKKRLLGSKSKKKKQYSAKEEVSEEY